MSEGHFITVTFPFRPEFENSQMIVLASDNGICMLSELGTPPRLHWEGKCHGCEAEGPVPRRVRILIRKLNCQVEARGR
jgi:hypothetical protein